LFMSYFQGRKQFVQINGKRSVFREIQTGIAQGSILGATLFLILINDIFNVALSGRIQLYADDAVLMYEASDFHTILVQMQNDIFRLNLWFSANNIRMNVSKTNFILFRKNTTALSTIAVNDTVITEVTSARYLGLFLDAQLRWEEHLNHVRQKILPMLFALRRTRTYISEPVAWQIYFAHIFSQLTYLNPIWSAASASRMAVLRVLQNKAIKIIKKFPWRHPSFDLYTPNILPLSVLADFNLLLTIYRVRMGMLKARSLLTEVSQVHSHGTRSSSNSNLYIDFARTSLGQSNVFFRGQLLFNQLPAAIKNSESILTFKNYIRLMLFERYEQIHRNNS
jgi:Reverse transcriptase (RNA-dependent DNA polymerase)